MKSSRSKRGAWGALAAALLASTLLASCGGGEQSSTFRATRVLAFGDETSVIRSDGRKYTVNALVTSSTSAIDCGSNPIWVQSLAAAFGLAFPQCPGSVVEPNSQIFATVGAKVADLNTQIDNAQTNGGFGNGDLVTVLVGVNDVIEQFNQYPAVGQDQLLANVDAAGTELAGQVNRLAALGAKVLISTIPDVGRMPFAGDRTAGSTNGNPAVLSALSKRFNDSLLSHLVNDGHQIGLIQLDEYATAVDNITQAGGSAGYVNTTLGACAVALPNCTTATLVPDALGVVWFWADDRHLGPTAQSNLSAFAITRAQNNPF